MSTKHEDIADLLTAEILAGQYRPGERLPSERDLAARFGANRGAVREAMKKLAQLGVASIAPGGARVNAIQEASLDVIGYLLARNALPDPRLLDQIMQVINALLTTAAENVVESGDDHDITAIRRLVRPLLQHGLDETEHLLARTELFREVMRVSDNLVCQLIARTLFEQFAPQSGGFHEFVRIDQPLYATYATELDRALCARDLNAVRQIFSSISQLHRQSVLQALDAAASAASRTDTTLTMAPREVAAS